VDEDEVVAFVLGTAVVWVAAAVVVGNADVGSIVGARVDVVSWVVVATRVVVDIGSDVVTSARLVDVTTVEVVGVVGADVVVSAMAACNTGGMVEDVSPILCPGRTLYSGQSAGTMPTWSDCMSKMIS
jgi:hypothetical protein